MAGTAAVAGAAGAPTVAAGVLLTLLPAAWVVWLVRDGSRGVYVAGAALALGMLLGSTGMLAAGVPATPGVAVGLAAQLALLQLSVAGAADLGAGVSTWSTRLGLAAVAITLSTLVAGIGHAHAATPPNPAGASAPAFLCHLI